MNLSPAQIATAVKCPMRNVTDNWPLIQQCLDVLSMADDPVCIAAAATVAVETAWTFKPIREFGSDATHEKLYGGRASLGNVNPGDGAKYAGRGFIQITGRNNYAHYGKLCGVDLIDNPDTALSPDCAATILAAYFQEHNIAAAARLRDWEKVRRLVNGGLNGYASFLGCVQRLNAAFRD